MDLRDRIADAIARTDHPTTATVHPLMEDYRDHADAVMGVVEEDAVKRRAYTERRVELARKAEAAIWETRVRELEDENQRMRDDLAQAVKMRDVNNRLLQCAADRANRAEAQARAARGTVADLEQQRDSIASRIVEEERGVQEQITEEPLNTWLAGVLFGLQRGRDIVTSPAREIAEEEA